MKTRLCIALLVAFAMPRPALAADGGGDDQLPADHRIVMLHYDASDVYTITTRYGYQTNIVFGSGERIDTISVGDRSMWQIIPAGNRLFIRPMDQDVATNMTILTSQHAYQFDLRSLPDDSKKGGNIYVARFVYGDDMPPPRAAMPEMREPETPPSAHTQIEPVKNPPRPLAGSAPPAHRLAPLPQHPNYDYTFSGPDELAPLQVFDDGRSTYFKMRDITQPLPNAYIINANGTQTLTTPYVMHGLMVIDAIAPEFALRSSNGTVYVYNETLNPK